MLNRRHKQKGCFSLYVCLSMSLWAYSVTAVTSVSQAFSFSLPTIVAPLLASQHKTQHKPVQPLISHDQIPSNAIKGCELCRNWFPGDWRCIFAVTMEMSKCGQDKLFLKKRFSWTSSAGYTHTARLTVYKIMCFCSRCLELASEMRRRVYSWVKTVVSYLLIVGQELQVVQN